MIQKETTVVNYSVCGAERLPMDFYKITNTGLLQQLANTQFNHLKSSERQLFVSFN